jgi:NAD(P)-dependent dehydrogenase (short-subunit alcohol dehydrogenase family)
MITRKSRIALLALTALSVATVSAAAEPASKGKVIVVMSGAHLLDLKDNKVYATGYYLNELATPLRALVEAGYTPVFASPDGDAPTMDASNEGTIINIASVLAIQALPVSAVYSGTKAYVLTFSQGLQSELADTGVKVQVVLPASTATEFWTEDTSGVPLAAIPQNTVMSAESLVDAALAGLDKNEVFTWPSVADDALWSKYDEARSALFAATQTGTPAPRYQKA